MISVRCSRSPLALALVVAWMAIVACQLLAGPRLAIRDGHAALRAVTVVQAVEPAEDASNALDPDREPLVTAIVTLVPHAAVTTLASPRPAAVTAVAWLQRDLVRSTRLRC